MPGRTGLGGGVRARGAEKYIVVLVWRGGVVKYELARVSHETSIVLH